MIVLIFTAEINDPETLKIPTTIPENEYQMLPKKKNSLNELKSFPPESTLIAFKQNK